MEIQMMIMKKMYSIGETILANLLEVSGLQKIRLVKDKRDTSIEGLQCPLCSIKYRSEFSLVKHIKKDHNIKRETDIEKYQHSMPRMPRKRMKMYACRTRTYLINFSYVNTVKIDSITKET